MLWALCLIAVAMGYWAIRFQPNLLPLGKFVAKKNIQCEQYRYYIEEVAFDDYQAAIHGYFNLVPEIQKIGKAEETHYDFFDFYSVAIRFEHCSVRLLRLVDKVRLIKSDRPIPLDEFEQRIQPFAYGGLK